MKNVNAILIDPEAQTVTTVQMDADGDHLRQMYALIGCELVTTVPLFDGHTAWLDDEGLLHSPKHFFELPSYANPLVGRCLITGTDWNDEGDVLVDVRLSVETITEQIEWWTIHDLRVRSALSRPQRAAMDRYAQAIGHGWKNALWASWNSGNYTMATSPEDCAVLATITEMGAALPALLEHYKAPRHPGMGQMH